MYDKFIALLFVLIFTGIATSDEAPDSLIQFENTFSTTFECDYMLSQIGVGKLIGGKFDLLIVRDSTGFDIYEFSNDNWQFINNLPNKQIAYSQDKPSLWTIGDLNNNGLDEIITWIDSSIITFEWNGDTFVKRVLDYSREIEQAIIGDIDNDNLNEMILFCYGKKLNESFPAFCYYICIVELVQNELKSIWTDEWTLGYGYSYVVPPDKLICIADITNMGCNQLAIILSQSDVSPSRYDLFQWKNNELVLISSPFDINIQENGIKPQNRDNVFIPGKPPGTIDSYFIGPFLPIKLDSKTLILGVRTCVRTSDRGSLMSFEHVLFRMGNGKSTVVTKLPDYGPVLTVPVQTLWMDPDGNGIGVLGIELKGLQESVLKFYRLLGI